MTHPPVDANPHIQRPADENPVTLHTTTAYTETHQTGTDDVTEVEGAGTDVRTDEGGEQPSASQAEQDGTALSTSSSTSEKSGSSGEKHSPKPALDAESPSA